MNDATTTHYNVTRRAYEAWRKAQQAYQWASNDYHTHARKSSYRSDWVQAAAFQVSLKAQNAFAAHRAYKAKESTFERLTKMPFFTPAT